MSQKGFGLCGERDYIQFYEYIFCSVFYALSNKKTRSSTDCAMTELQSSTFLQRLLHRMFVVCTKNNSVKPLIRSKRFNLQCLLVNFSSRTRTPLPV